MTGGTTKFDVILADPPWQHTKGRKNRTDSDGDMKWWGTTESHYNGTLTNQDIANFEYEGLPIRELVADNAALFLWTCWPMILEMQPIFDAWGFEYKTLAWIWMKQKPSSGHQFMVDVHSLAMGFGYYTRSVSEPCLLGVRGSMPPSDRSVKAVIFSPRKEHSQKPYEQYDLIDALYPNTNKLELFARREEAGWTAHGNQLQEPR